jgi:uncharacterized protein (DUF58 family)
MKWFFGLLLLLLAALALQSSLLAYSAYVLLGLLIISRFLARRWAAGVSASRICRLTKTDEETAPVGLGPPGGKDDRPTGLSAEIGDRVAVRLTVRNDGPLPVLWVLLEDLIPASAIERRPPRLKVKGKRVQVRMLRPRATVEVRYQVECLARGYYPIGPLVVETGDLFGLHRRYRVAAGPTFVLVYPRIVPLTGYELASRRPIGDVRLTHRLYEDPTRIAGVRPYEPGDPLNRVHWRATARTGTLHSKIQEPSTLAGATVMLDLHTAGYHQRGEPYRSELAVVTAMSLANAVCQMNQQIGLVTNGRDAADRIRLEGLHGDDPRTRQAAHAVAPMSDSSSRLEPVIVPTRRSIEQLQRIREVLARVELTDGLTFAELVVETAPRLPRDATVVAVLPEVPQESAIALGNLRRRGLAVTVVLVILEELPLEAAYARLTAEGIRDLRHLQNEDELPDLVRRQVQRATPYDFATLGG